MSIGNTANYNFFGTANDTLSTQTSLIPTLGAVGAGSYTIAYNNFGFPETITYSSGVVYTLTYNSYNRLNTVSNGKNVVTCQYNTYGQFTGTTIA